jgi:hypothetical protein
MKQILLTITVVVVFGLAALAQDTTPASPQSGTQSTNPTTGNSSTSSATGTGQYGGTSSGTQSSSPSTAGSMGQSSNSDNQASTKGEKKLKGCIESQGGQYVLQEKNGSQVQLAGSADFASHVGHQVTVHGTYEGSATGAAASSNERMPSSSGSPTANPSTSTSSTGQQFMVNKIDHESSTCKLKGASTGANSGMGTSGASSNGTQAPDHQ